MITPSDRAIPKFNPGTFQSDEQVIEQFVVRSAELDKILKTLRAKQARNALIVGPRGIGKTMLLARIAAEIRTNREFSDAYVPIQIMEDNHEIFNVDDFWIEVLFHLVRACDDPEVVHDVQNTYADIVGRWRERKGDNSARHAVFYVAERISKTLVIMVENLQTLRVTADDDFFASLLHALHTERRAIVIASATTHFPELDDAKGPLMRLFRRANRIDLKPLDEAQCKVFWRAITGNEIDEHKVRPFRIITGGNPRLLLIAARFLGRRTGSSLFEDIVHLVDENTEGFRRQVESISARTERRVYLSVVDLWKPSSLGEITRRARLDVRTVATMLGRLMERGLVERVEGGRGRHLYTVAERLYSICYKLQREREEDSAVRSLLEFMARFYDRPRLDPGHREFATALLRTGAEAGERGDTGGEIQAYDELIASWEDSYESDKQVQVARAWIAKGIALRRSGAVAEEISAYDHVERRHADTDLLELQVAVAESLVNKGIAERRRGDTDAELAAYELGEERYGNSDAPELQVHVAEMLVNRGVAHRQQQDFEKEITAYRSVQQRFGGSDDRRLQERVAWALINLGVAHRRHRDFAQEIVAYESVEKSFGSSSEWQIQVQVARGLVSKGVAHVNRGDFDRGVAAYDDVEERYGHRKRWQLQVCVADMLINRGAMEMRRGNIKEAIAAFKLVESRYGTSDVPELQVCVADMWIHRGMAEGRRNDVAAALTAYESVERHYQGSTLPELRVQVARALVKQATLKREHGSAQSALTICDRVESEYGGSTLPELQVCVAHALLCRAQILIEVGSIEQALKTCEKVRKTYGSLTDETEVPIAWRVRWLMIAAWLAQSKPAIAIDEFRSAYVEFDPKLGRMLHYMMDGVSALIKKRTVVRDVVEILLSDRKKSAALQPLVVAVRRLAGETVRLPREVSEVAKDVSDRIGADGG